MKVFFVVIGLIFEAVLASPSGEHYYRSRLSYKNPSSRMKRLDFTGGIPVFRSTLIEDFDTNNAASNVVASIVRPPTRFVDRERKRDVVVFNSPEFSYGYETGSVVKAESSVPRRNYYPVSSSSPSSERTNVAQTASKRAAYNYKIVGVESRVKPTEPTLPPKKRKKKKKKIIFIQSPSTRVEYTRSAPIEYARSAPVKGRQKAPAPGAYLTPRGGGRQGRLIRRRRPSTSFTGRRLRAIYADRYAASQQLASYSPASNQHTASLTPNSRVTPYTAAAASFTPTLAPVTPTFSPFTQFTPAIEPAAPTSLRAIPAPSFLQQPRQPRQPPQAPQPPPPPPKLAKLTLDESSVEVKPASYATPSVKYDIAPTVKPPPTEKPRSSKNFASFLTPVPAVVKKTTEAPTTPNDAELFRTISEVVKTKKMKKKRRKKTPTVIKPFATSQFEPIASLRPLATARENLRGVADSDDSVRAVQQIPRPNKGIPLNIVSTTTASNGDRGSKVIHVTRKPPKHAVTTPKPQELQMKDTKKQKEQTKMLLRMLNALKAKKANLMDMIRREKAFTETESAPESLQRLEAESDSDYNLQYEVASGGNSALADHSRTETRDGRQIRGQYRVALPDGRTQVVDYTADETGFHPTITYESAAIVRPIAASG